MGKIKLYAARARMRAAAAQRAACQQNSRRGDGVGRDACETPLMKQDLRSLESLDQQVVRRLELVWLSSPLLRLGSRVSLRTWTVLVGQGLTRRRAATVCASALAILHALMSAVASRALFFAEQEASASMHHTEYVYT